MSNYFFLILFFAVNAKANFQYNTRGNLKAKFLNYTSNQENNYGIFSRGLIEQSTTINKNIEALNQAFFESNSLAFDLQTKTTSSKKDVFKTLLGENYLKFKFHSFSLVTGYQYVSWGEAFGINYADLINPKDNRITYFNDSNEAKIPLLMINTKYLFSIDSYTGSVQFVYSPEPKYNTTLPLDLFLSDKLPQKNYVINKEKTKPIFKESESGGKISISHNGLDASLFYFNYFDRSPYYNLNSIDLNTINANEKHQKIKSSGVSLAKTIFDYVLRIDFVHSKDKRYNYIFNNSLTDFLTDESNAVISIDSPTYQDYSFVLVAANSSIDRIYSNSFREKNERYLIGKIQKNLDRDKNLEVSYGRELINNGNTIQSSLYWPINNHNDLKIGGEFYFGNKQSALSKLKQVSNIFFSITNYFEL